MLLSFLQITALAVLLAYAGLAVMALLVAPRLLFPVPPASYAADERTVFLTLANGQRVATLYLPAPGAKRVILYHHGNAEDLGQVRPRLDQLQERGYAVFGYDYPGYGASEGRPSERSLLAAAEAAYLHLTTRLDWEPEQIVHFGHSLGGGPAIHLGARHPSGGVVVEATFTSVFRVMTRRRLLPWDLFDNLAQADALQAPLLVLHGRQDRTVPFWHGEALATRAKARFLWVDEAHHVNLWDVAGEEFWETLADFTDQREHDTVHP